MKTREKYFWGMRRLFVIVCLLLVMVLLVPSAWAQEIASDLYAASIEKALDLIEETWKEMDLKVADAPYVDIKNTRIIKIKETPVNTQNENQPVEELEGVDYIIEFMMITNYYGDSYPCNSSTYDTVIVYRDGSMEVQKMNLLYAVRAKYYMTDYSGAIEEIIDLADSYDGELF